MGRRSRTRLYQDTDLGVLWLSSGHAELALSTAGIWLTNRRTEADLPWAEIEQVQQADVRRDRARVQVFGRDGSAYAVGPFPATQGERWIRAAGDAALAAGWAPRRLDGAIGFALAVNVRR